MRKNHSRSEEYYLRVSLYLFLLVFSMGLITISLVNIYSRQNITDHGVSALGVVSKVDSISNTDVDVLAFQIKFKHRGSNYYIYNDNLSSESRYHLNEQVPVKFLTDYPEKAIIDTTQENGYPLVLLIGLGFLGMTVYFFKNDKTFALSQR